MINDSVIVDNIVVAMLYSYVWGKALNEKDIPVWQWGRWKHSICDCSVVNVNGRK